MLVGLRDRRLVFLGQISYGIYLYHYPVYYLIDTMTGHGTAWWAVALKIVTSLAVASLSWRWIESPILGLKSRFSYRRDQGGPDGVTRSVTGPSSS